MFIYYISIMDKFKARKESSIYNIRVFHNWVKRELINQVCSYLHDIHDVKDISLLDLSCGKGGDINKFLDAGIMEVVGFDIDEASILEARKRYNELINQLKSKNIRNLPKYEFYVMDLSKVESINKISEILHNRKFNIVSCQFAIHYFFKDMESLNNILTITENHIDNNGYFIGTTMNGVTIRNLLKKNSAIGNDIFNISYNNFTNSMYGNKYTVSLGKSSDTDHYFSNKPSIEYLVDIDELKKMSNNHNLIFVGTINFSEWYNSYKRNLLRNNEKEFSFLNFSFIFKKSPVN